MFKTSLRKLKINKSLQKKIVIVVGIILLYHFIFGDVSNRNVEIEVIKLESAYIGNYSSLDV